jgi:prophage regulatory protein
VVGAAELAERLGVSKSRVHQIVNHKNFPDPYAELRIGRVWLAEDVEAWISEHRPGSARKA